MHYEKEISLKDGRKCLLRNAFAEDAEKVLKNFNRAHEETDYLLSYPGETNFSVEDEKLFLRQKEQSSFAAEICAIVDDHIVGAAGLEPVGMREKTRHRASCGISIERKYWGLGIGRALMTACIESAREAGYSQLELDVVAENKRALGLYQSLGFTEYGRNPKGFKSRISGWQELVLMRLELG